MSTCLPCRGDPSGPKPVRNVPFFRESGCGQAARLCWYRAPRPASIQPEVSRAVYGQFHRRMPFAYRGELPALPVLPISRSELFLFPQRVDAEQSGGAVEVAVEADLAKVGKPGQDHSDHRQGTGGAAAFPNDPVGPVGPPYRMRQMVPDGVLGRYIDTPCGQRRKRFLRRRTSRRTGSRHLSTSAAAGHPDDSELSRSGAGHRLRVPSWRRPSRGPDGASISGTGQLWSDNLRRSLPRTGHIARPGACRVLPGRISKPVTRNPPCHIVRPGACRVLSRHLMVPSTTRPLTSACGSGPLGSMLPTIVRYRWPSRFHMSECPGNCRMCRDGSRASAVGLNGDPAPPPRFTIPIQGICHIPYRVDSRACRCRGRMCPSKSENRPEQKVLSLGGHWRPDSSAGMSPLDLVPGSMSPVRTRPVPPTDCAFVPVHLAKNHAYNLSAAQMVQNRYHDSNPRCENIPVCKMESRGYGVFWRTRAKWAVKCWELVPNVDFSHQAQNIECD